MYIKPIVLHHVYNVFTTGFVTSLSENIKWLSYKTDACEKQNKCIKYMTYPICFMHVFYFEHILSWIKWNLSLCRNKKRFGKVNEYYLHLNLKFICKTMILIHKLYDYSKIILCFIRVNFVLFTLQYTIYIYIILYA